MIPCTWAGVTRYNETVVFMKEKAMEEGDDPFKDVELLNGGNYNEI